MDDYQFRWLQDNILGITSRLDKLNGRVGETEQEVAVLQDRSNRAEKTGSVYGAVAGGAVGGVMVAIKAWLDR